MGVKTFQELGAWRLAYELRKKCMPVLRRTLKAKDYKLYDQIREAARSGPRNIAEGFGRYKHADFARFVRISKASETELLNHFEEAQLSGYVDTKELGELQHAAKKALKAANGLLRYLESTPDVD